MAVESWVGCKINVLQSFLDSVLIITLNYDIRSVLQTTVFYYD